MTRSARRKAGRLAWSAIWGGLQSLKYHIEKLDPTENLIQLHRVQIEPPQMADHASLSALRRALRVIYIARKT